MRTGKFLEHLQALVRALSIQDPVVAYTAVGRQASYAAYLVFDSLQWVHGSKAYQFAPDTYKTIAKNAARFWLLGLTFSLISGAYKSNALRSRRAAALRPRATAEKEAERKVELQQIKKEEGAVRWQLVQDALDWINPATTAEFTSFDDGGESPPKAMREYCRNSVLNHAISFAQSSVLLERPHRSWELTASGKLSMAHLQPRSERIGAADLFRCCDEVESEVRTPRTAGISYHWDVRLLADGAQVLQSRRGIADVQGG